MAVAREAGWYSDPDRPGRHRYWTGADWQSDADRLTPETDEAPVAVSA